MNFQITEALTGRQHHEVARFRYQTYVEEMGREQRYADHLRRVVHEPLDETGRVVVAYDSGGNVAGTVRMNCGADGDLGEYAEFYELASFGDHFPDHVTITTKLMVAPRYRASRLGLRLAMDAYSYGLARGALMDFIDCNPHLEGFFGKLGYRAYCGRKCHPEYGDVLPMVLVGSDWMHLSLVGSPFLRCAERVLGLPRAAFDYRRKRALSSAAVAHRGAA